MGVRIDFFYLIIFGLLVEKAAFWKDLTGTHPYNPDPEETNVRAGGLVGDEMEKNLAEEDVRSDG